MANFTTEQNDTSVTSTRAATLLPNVPIYIFFFLWPQILNQNQGRLSRGDGGGGGGGVQEAKNEVLNARHFKATPKYVGAIQNIFYREETLEKDLCLEEGDPAQAS